MSYTRPYRKTGDLLVGSWTRTVAVLAVAVVVFCVIAWAAASGSLATIGTWNIPLVHPYPPAGYYLNPFSASPKPELVNASTAAQVRRDFVSDGQLEVDAFARGDASLLSTGETGPALTKAQQLVASNNSQGIYEVAQNRIDKVIVGLLTDPNQPDVRWCVRETGESTISSIDKGTGQTVRQGKSRFDSKYWLVKVGDRYLITDRQVVTQPLPAGS